MLGWMGFCRTRCQLDDGWCRLKEHPHRAAAYRPKEARQRSRYDWRRFRRSHRDAQSKVPRAIAAASVFRLLAEAR